MVGGQYKGHSGSVLKAQVYYLMVLVGEGVLSSVVSAAAGGFSREANCTSCLCKRKNCNFKLS